MKAQGIEMTPALLAAVRARDAQESDGRNHIEIWPDMAAGVLTFFACDTQWRKGFMGSVDGLDYTALKPTAELLGLTLDAQAFHDIRVLENETLKALRRNKK